MASNLLTKEEQNFIRFVKARDDVMPLPLRDILHWQIKPKDLHQKIQSCLALTNGEKKLDSYQMNQTKLANYNNFDVTLLYKLIRNLCPGLKPTQGWGIRLNYNDTTIGDDIERIRVFRNELGHSKSSKIPDSEFANRWIELKVVIERLQKAMSKSGYITDYKEKLKGIEELDFGDEPREKYKTFLLLECAFDHLQLANDREEPVVSIAGNENAMCGENAVFKAEVTNVDPSFWSLTWQKTREHVTESININKEKYLGSTDRRLVITSVSKEDEWKYQAVLSRNTNGYNQKTLSNEILLQTLGVQPNFNVWNVTTDMDGITIHYAIEDRPPTVYNIEWTRNGKLLDFENTKYVGGSLKDMFLKITSPTEADRAKYCCTVTNAVGSTSKDVTFDLPAAEISTEPQSFYGSCVLISSKVVSCPAPDGAQWQKSDDGLTFHGIDIREAKYYGSSLDPESPSLEIKTISFVDKQYYRLFVRNKIGEHVSNMVYLNVIGNRPNVTICHKTYIKNHSVTLNGTVFLYEDFLEIQNLFWSKNGQNLESHKIGGKYLEVGMDNPSLTIFDINQHDAGSYQLIATNAVGSTQSNVIALGNPDVFLEKCVRKEDDSWWFTMKIKSIPSPCFVQWTVKEKEYDSFKEIDINADDYKGTSISLPYPVLVVKKSEQLQTSCFQIEVRNYIGSCKKSIRGDIYLETPIAVAHRYHTLSSLYNDRGASVIFANLFDELAEAFPNDQITRLQDLIRFSGKVKDLTSLKQANCARDCFRILNDENLFTNVDVIFVQYLLKTTHCDKLYRKCYEYARSQKALCFYEMPTENGFSKVKFHVKAHLPDYTTKQIEIIKDTVAAILGCTTAGIFVSGYDHSTSFFVVLSIRQLYLRKLFAMEEQEKEKLTGLNIDYFIVDFITVYINRPNEKTEGWFPGKLLSIRKIPPSISKPLPIQQQNKYELSKISLLISKTRARLTKEKTCLGQQIPIGTSLPIQLARVELAKQNLPCHKKKPELIEEKLFSESETSSKQLFKDTATQKATIILPLEEICHISCMKSDNLWVAGFKRIIEIDISGNILKKIDVDLLYCGYHTVTSGGDLLFLNKNSVYKLAFGGDLDILCTPIEKSFCIHSSRINRDILVGTRYNVTRYTETGHRLQKIQMCNEKGDLIPRYITENINGDIVVSDGFSKTVEAVDNTGRHRFSYTGHHSESEFRPTGICTDIFGHILVANDSFFNSSIHLIDAEGNFLSHIVRNIIIYMPHSLCVDEKRNLYVGSFNSIAVYSYLTPPILEERKELELKKERKANLYKCVCWKYSFIF